MRSEEQVDDLGYAYEITTDSDDIEITEWTTFIDGDGRFTVSAVTHQLPGTEKVEDIFTTLRIYDSENNLLGAYEVINVAYTLEPGGYNRFGEPYYNVEPSAIDHYALELKVVR